MSAITVPPVVKSFFDNRFVSFVLLLTWLVVSYRLCFN